MVTKTNIMKVLKFSKLQFAAYFMLWFILFVALIIVFFRSIYQSGLQVNHSMFFLAFIIPVFFIFFTINYYLYDKDTIIEIDENSNVTYSNITQKYFHLEDIDLCTELIDPALGIGLTEILLKNGDSFYVSSFISLEPMYKIIPNIKRESLAFSWPIILRRKNNILK